MQHVVIGLVELDGRFLFLQKKDGFCTFPSGKQEPDETLEEALIREVLEETGAAVTVGEFLGSRNLSDELTVHYFKCDLVDPDFKHQMEDDKFQSLGWYSPKIIQDISGDKMFFAVKEFLDRNWKANSELQRTFHGAMDAVIASDWNSDFMQAQMAYLEKKTGLNLTRSEVRGFE